MKYGQWIPLEARILGRKEIRGKQFEVVEILDLDNMVRYLILLSSIHLMHLVIAICLKKISLLKTLGKPEFC